MSYFKDFLFHHLVPLINRLEPLLPPKKQEFDWQKNIAARFCSNGINQNIKHLKPIKVGFVASLDDLQGLDQQKHLLEQNTKQFLRSAPFNHALLWGARGTGKSTLVRSILLKFVNDGLRLVEIDAQDLIELPKIIDYLRSYNYKFVIFCDDLSFSNQDREWRLLKSVLDGSLETTFDNVVIYATSNRRHLLPENQSDNFSYHNIDGEIHPGDVVEEKIALADRFGLWLSFYSFSQEEYLNIVKHWLKIFNESYDFKWEWNDSLRNEALKFAQLRANRNGRCAYQFVKSFVGKHMIV